MNQEYNQKFYRKAIRLKDYDYSQPGAYFVTIVTQSRKCLFGKVDNGKMILNEGGRMIEHVCREVEMTSPWLNLGSYQVMPNHIHLIINLGESGFIDDKSTDDRKTTINNGSTQKSIHLSLFDVIGRIKSISTLRYIQGVRGNQWPMFDKRLWQRSYYDHVIRDEKDYEVISEYILSNPMNWDKDEDYCVV